MKRPPAYTVDCPERLRSFPLRDEEYYTHTRIMIAIIIIANANSDVTQ